MRDIFDRSNTEEKESRNLKSFAVKLPEETIEDFEALFELSGSRFKNEFFQNMIQEYKLKIADEKPTVQKVVHPDVLISAKSDLLEMTKLVENMNKIYLSQLDKFSRQAYELEEMKEENRQLKQSSSSVINEYLEKKSKEHFGNRLYLGNSGTGKTYAIGLEIKKAIEMGKKVIVVDPQGEYKRLTESLNGSYIQLSEDEGRLNPFEFYPVENGLIPLTQKILDLYSFIEILVKRNFSVKERKCLLGAIESTYDSFGYTREHKPDNNVFPTLVDLEKTLRRYGDEGINLADELEPFTSGILSYFNGERNVQITDSPIITFGLHNIERVLSYPAVFNVLEFISQMLKNPAFKNTIVVFDEAFLIYQTEQCSRLCLAMLHFSQNKNIEYLFSTQQPADFLRNFEMALPFFDTFILLRIQPMDIQYLKNYEILSDEQLQLLRAAKKGEAIIKKQDNFPFLMTFPLDKEFALLLNPLSIF